MKIVLTGITGSLGSEVFLKLTERKHEVIGILRSDKKIPYLKEVILCDLEKETPNDSNIKADFVIHCAGSIHLNKSDLNAAMTKNALRLAEQLEVPFCHVSTAYLSSRNPYEIDKLNAENLVNESNVDSIIVRPSILAGRSDNGEINQFSGYYLVIKAFSEILSKAQTKIRVPFFHGETNLIPIDLVANSIVKLVEENKYGTYYATNSKPFDSNLLIRESLEFLGLLDKVDFVDLTFEEYTKLNLSELEIKLSSYLKHFIGYWSGKHSFTNSIIDNKIDFDYIHKILLYAEKAGWLEKVYARTKNIL
jgi:nucleoside-diphosphate-sugar epimerase